MNYAEMSDFQINLAAAHIALGVDGYDWSTEKQEVYIAGMDGGEFLPQAHFNPCNSWADAGPIIQCNKITILTDEATEEWSAAVVQDFCDERAFKFSNCAKTPLRAAMVTFMMMQEGE